MSADDRAFRKIRLCFAGSHPMAGKETNGFDVSDADLYKNASYIIVPCKADNSVVNMLSDFANQSDLAQ